MALFDRLQAEGNTIVLVTHEHDIAEYAHRVIYIKRRRGGEGREKSGKVVDQSSVFQLSATPGREAGRFLVRRSPAHRSTRGGPGSRGSAMVLLLRGLAFELDHNRRTWHSVLQCQPTIERHSEPSLLTGQVRLSELLPSQIASRSSPWRPRRSKLGNCSFRL